MIGENKRAESITSTLLSIMMTKMAGLRGKTIVTASELMLCLLMCNCNKFTLLITSLRYLS